MISLENVCFSFESTEVVSDVTLNIEKGTLLTLVGESGCGKSTLLQLIAGLKKPYKGTIEIDGITLEGIRQKTAILFQDLGLFPWKSVLENITFILEDRGMSKPESKETALETLKSVGMDSFAGRYPNSLSGGQRQRVAFAKAIALKPDVLLLDEATASLDAFSSETVQDILKKIHQTQAMTMVVVTHKIDEAVYLGEKIAVMKSGKIIETFHNPTVHLIDQRSDIEFFDMCNKVKEAIHYEAMD